MKRKILIMGLPGAGKTTPEVPTKYEVHPTQITA
jgi:hypothetical protein